MSAERPNSIFETLSESAFISYLDKCGVPKRQYVGYTAIEHSRSFQVESAEDHEFPQVGQERGWAIGDRSQQPELQLSTGDATR